MASVLPCGNRGAGPEAGALPLREYVAKGRPSYVKMPAEMMFGEALSADRVFSADVVSSNNNAETAFDPVI